MYGLPRLAPIRPKHKIAYPSLQFKAWRGVSPKFWVKILGMMLVVSPAAASESTRLSTRVCLEPHDNSAV